MVTAASHSGAGSPTTNPSHLCLALLSSDIWLKSARTRSRMITLVKSNLAAALGEGARVGVHHGHRLRIRAPGSEAISLASRVFGIASVEVLAPLRFGTMEEIACRIAERSVDAVRGRTFALRTRRRGEHDWRSNDLNRRAGELLVAEGGIVDLDDPEVPIEVRIGPRDAATVVDVRAGPGGLPLGSQDRALVLLSGGLDSPVAAWLMMSRGCGADFVHFVLDCAQADHALSVAHQLWSQWGHGDDPVADVVDFREVAEAVRHDVPERLRQVVLKALMMRAASALARESRHPAIVTGESLGQVSSQTLTHLAALSAQAASPVLRPLLGLDKDEILRRARAIGTYELSARARENCDLGDGGPVEVAAGRAKVVAASERVGDAAWRTALQRRVTLPLSGWMPGSIAM